MTSHGAELLAQQIASANELLQQVEQGCSGFSDQLHPYCHQWTKTYYKVCLNSDCALKNFSFKRACIKAPANCRLLKYWQSASQRGHQL